MKNNLSRFRKIQESHKIPKIATIQDISGYGRCSSTIALPVLSVLGCNVSLMPTAILSNHTMFEDFFSLNFTEYLKDYYRSWKKNNCFFDCIYTGFLGSSEQIDIISRIIDDARNENNSLVVVDPVMGDLGQIYVTYTEDMLHRMKDLVKKSDIITPNVTELCILAGEKYKVDLTEEELLSYIKKIDGPELIVVTGANVNGKYNNAIYDVKNNVLDIIDYEYTRANYPGTGDLFASLFIGYIFQGETYKEAIRKGSEFISKCISYTNELKTNPIEGVCFEKFLCELN